MPLGASDVGDSSDLDAETKESEVDFNAETVDTGEHGIIEGATAETPHQIVLRYAQNTDKTLADHFPKGKITKEINKEIILERSRTADVLLNSETFGRQHAALACREQQNGDLSLIVRNRSKKKKIFVVSGDGKRTVTPGSESELVSKDTIQMEKLTFVVEIQEGDVEAKSFEFQMKCHDEPALSESSGQNIQHRIHGNTPGPFMNHPCFVPPCGLGNPGIPGQIVNAPVQSAAPYGYHQHAESYSRAPQASVGHTYKGSIMSQPTTDDITPGFLPSPPQGNFFQQGAAGASQMPRLTYVFSAARQLGQPLTSNFVTGHAVEENSQCQGHQGQRQSNPGHGLPGMGAVIPEGQGGANPEIGYPDYYANANSISLGGVNERMQ
ncbi:uncharacterized protein LOC121388584 [Gigantopelta aegis]|uniref:uncharacterized protein LOC121388584 n=1 Tax=Gigantopelta aegis TaxID=1735272 RepID=UPI001B889426|nr:uncharacterized protein LOC121388584 [Gigantopelta aegis]